MVGRLVPVEVTCRRLARHCPPVGGGEQFNAGVLPICQRHGLVGHVAIKNNCRADAEGACRGVEPADHATQLVLAGEAVFALNAGGGVLAGTVEQAIDLHDLADSQARQAAAQVVIKHGVGGHLHALPQHREGACGGVDSGQRAFDFAAHADGRRSGAALTGGVCGDV